MPYRGKPCHFVIKPTLVRGGLSRLTPGACDQCPAESVAPQLTVVPAPPFNQALERMRGTPSLRGWRPTRRWHMKRQQFSDRPAMIRDTSRHRRCCPATGVGQTRMRGAEIIDRTDQIHAMLQRQRAARQRSTSACQRCQTRTKRRVQPLDVRCIDHASPWARRLSVSTRAGVPSTMRRSTSTTRRWA